MVDLDDLFSYKTPKYVTIRDRKLGFVQKGFMVLILLKIVGLTILYHCKHLKRTQIVGFSVAELWQPTKKCNPLSRDCHSSFTPYTDLPYCSQSVTPELTSEPKTTARSQTTGTPDSGSDDSGSSGSSDSSDNSDALEKDTSKRSKDRLLGAVPPRSIAPCMLLDSFEIHSRHPHPNMLFVPTRVTTYKQERGCRPSDENKWRCHGSPFESLDEVPETSFIADVEQFLIRIDHSYQVLTPSGEMDSGRAGFFNGSFIEENTPMRFGGRDDTRGHVRQKHADGTSTFIPIPKRNDKGSPLASLEQTKVGDLISVGDLMRAADPRGLRLLDAARKNGKTMRWTGAIVAVDIEYDNDAKMDPFGQQPPHYGYHVKILPLVEYSLKDARSIDGKRVVVDTHGILFVFHVHGLLREFSYSTLLETLTTALVSLVMANAVTDFVMMYLMDLRSKYTILKYQPSQDFSEFRDRESRILKSRTQTEGYTQLTPRGQRENSQSDVLEKCILNDESPPSGRNLLAVLVKFEQRLNCLDAGDVKNLMLETPDDQHPSSDTMENFMGRFERDWQNSSFPDDAGNSRDLHALQSDRQSA